MNDPAPAVRAYYERNTRLFLRLGIGWRTLAMRRAVWAEGVESLPQAVEYVNALIAEQIRARAVGSRGLGARVLDIGCGVGGSLIFLAGAVGSVFRGTGVTISPRQAEIAQRQARRRGLSEQLSFYAADFTVASGLPRHHLAFAIESFVHFSAPEAFFSAAARSLEQAGRLILVDDFLAAKDSSRSERLLVDAFRYGWLLSSLCTVDRAARAAEAHGMRLVEDHDLSSSLSSDAISGRVGSWLVRVMRAIPLSWTYWRSTVGSLALACCQPKGLIQYHFLVFEKQEG